MACPCATPPAYRVVSAPAGFGKTTLITSWIRQTCHRRSDAKSYHHHDGRLVAWLSLDENDNDAVHFLSYMIAALQRIDQKVGETAISLEQALRLTVPEDYQRSFLDEGVALANLLPKLTHVAPTFVEKLLAAFGVVERRDDDKPPQPSNPLLTPLKEREFSIMQLVAHGDSNRQIAEKLHLTVGTVKWYLNQIYLVLTDWGG